MVRLRKDFTRIFLLLFIIISVFGLCACGNEKPDNSDDKEEVNFCNMYEDLIEDDIYYRVYEASIQKTIPSTLGGTIKTDYFFMYIKIKITNNSKRSKDLFLSNFTLTSPSGKTYEAKDYVYMYNRMKNATIGAGFSKEYYIVYEIPEKETDGNYKLVIDKYLLFWKTDPYIIINDWYSIYGE